MFAGVNFDTPGHFDNLLMYTSASSNHVRDSIQGSMRVRHITNDRLFFSSYPVCVGGGRPRIFSRVRLHEILTGRENFVRGMEDNIFSGRATLAPWLKALWVHNHQEDNVSAHLHAPLLRAYLDECGYRLLEGSELDFPKVCTSDLEVPACRWQPAHSRHSKGSKFLYVRKLRMPQVPACPLRRVRPEADKGERFSSRVKTVNASSTRDRTEANLLALRQRKGSDFLHVSRL